MILPSINNRLLTIAVRTRRFALWQPLLSSKSPRKRGEMTKPKQPERPAPCAVELPAGCHAEDTIPDGEIKANNTIVSVTEASTP